MLVSTTLSHIVRHNAMMALVHAGCRSAARCANVNVCCGSCGRCADYPKKVMIYSRGSLLALRRIKTDFRHFIPQDKAKAIAKKQHQLRYKPPIPSVLMGNVNALPNKMDELAALIKNQQTYRESCLIILTDTWLTAHIPDANVELPGFTTVRADRDTNASGKSKGGGLVLYVNNRWSNPGHCSIKSVICCCDCELLAVSLRPYYIPREFTQVIVICVYIPPRANMEAALDAVHSITAGLQTQRLWSSFQGTSVTSPWTPLCRPCISTWTVPPRRTGPLTCCMPT